MAEPANRIYLDHAATTPLDDEVFAVMEPWLRSEGEFGNPSAVYQSGHRARQAIDEARSTIAGVLNCSPQELIFTAGGTESDNLAILGAARAAGSGKIVTTVIEHPAVLEPCQALEQEGFELEVVPVERNGIVSVDELVRTVDDTTILVSVMLANNEIGTIQPVAEITKAVKAKNPETLVHTDACQATGALSLDVTELGVDLLTINASKIYGPKGVGALYIKRGTKLKPLTFGGGQEQALRPGTENVAGIVGFAKAVEIADAQRADENERLTKLRNQLVDGILKSIPDTILNGDRDKRLPNNANILIKGIDGEALIFQLDQAGIEAALGSACATGSIEPSKVLRAICLTDDDSRRSLRLTLGRNTTEAEIDQVLELLSQIVKNNRQNQ